jgi:hypothetical protein
LVEREWLENEIHAGVEHADVNDCNRRIGSGEKDFQARSAAQMTQSVECGHGTFYKRPVCQYIFIVPAVPAG